MKELLWDSVAKNGIVFETVMFTVVSASDVVFVLFIHICLHLSIKIYFLFLL